MYQYTDFIFAFFSLTQILLFRIESLAVHAGCQANTELPAETGHPRTYGCSALVHLDLNWNSPGGLPQGKYNGSGGASQQNRPLISEMGQTRRRGGDPATAARPPAADGRRSEAKWRGVPTTVVSPQITLPAFSSHALHSRCRIAPVRNWSVKTAGSTGLQGADGFSAGETQDLTP